MPITPAAGNLHVDQFLSNVSVIQTSEAYVADEAASLVPVTKERDRYATYNLAHARISEIERAMGSTPNRFAWDASSTAFACVEKALDAAIDDRQREVADEPYDMDFDTAEFLREKLLLDREFEVLGTLTTGGNYTNTSSPGTKWDASGGTPVADVQQARATVRSSFRAANQLTTSEEVVLELAAATDVRNLSTYVRDLAKDWGVPNPFLGLKLVVATARYLTSNEGQADTTGAVFGAHAIVHYVNPNFGRRSLTHYTQFRYKDVQISRYRDEKILSDVIVAKKNETLARINDVAGYLYTDVLT